MTNKLVAAEEAVRLVHDGDTLVFSGFGVVGVPDALDRIDLGDFADGVIRMLIFLANSRKEVRRSRLERSNQMLLSTEPFASMKPKHRMRMTHPVAIPPDEPGSVLRIA